MTDEPEPKPTPEPDRLTWLVGLAREREVRDRMRRDRMQRVGDGARFELWRRRIVDATVRIGRPR